MLYRSELRNQGGQTLRTLDTLTAWLLIAFGAVHIALTGKAYPGLGIKAIWFVCGGLFMITVGALNLLRVAYGSVARGVYVVSVIANLVLLLLLLWIATLFPLRNNPQVVVGLILTALLIAFAVFRRSGERFSRQTRQAG